VLRNEQGCLRFDVLPAEADRTKVFLYEVYADAAAIDLHMATPYMAEYLSDTGPMVRSRRRSRCVLAHG